MTRLWILVCIVMAAVLQGSAGNTDPSAIPSANPSANPSADPSAIPSAIPSVMPTTFKPTVEPTVGPTPKPTPVPTAAPTVTPTASPTATPSRKPTAIPTSTPTARPTTGPSIEDPILLSYTLDCSIGKLLLTFDRLISAKTVDVTGITFQSIQDRTQAGAQVAAYALTSSYNRLSLQGNTTDLTIYLTADDIASVLLSPPLCRTLGGTYISLVRDSIMSPFGYSNVEVSRTHAMAPTTLVPDNFPPYVTSFSLFMDTGVMWLTFTEPIDPATFTLDGLTIQSRAYLGDATNDPILERQTQNLVDLGASLVALTDRQRTIHYQLGSTNMNRIKALLGLAITLETSFVSAWKPFVSDTSGNPVSLQGFDKLHALKATHYLPDLEPPTLLYWDFDVNIGSISMTFSETVYREFFNYSKVIFTSGSTTSGQPLSTLRVDNPVNLTLTTSNTATLTFSLNELQFNLLKSYADLLKIASVNSFVVVEYNAVVDTSAAQNPYLGLDATPANPMPVRVFISDTIDPQLQSFALNMDARLLTLRFTETVKLSSVRIGELTLQSDRAIGVTTEVLTLSPLLATVASVVDSPVVILSLSTTAFSQLKAFKKLAKSADTTFVSMTRRFVTDRAGNSTHPANAVEEVSPGYGQMAREYIPDRSAPLLESWYLDLTLDQLVLTFSKPVDSGTLNPALVTLFSDAAVLPSTVSLQLSDESFVIAEELNVVTVQLSLRDARKVRLLGAEDFCTEIATCFLSVPAGFVNDTTGVTVEGQAVHTPLVAVSVLEGSSYIADAVPPKLLNYSIDLSALTISLVFDEPVVPRHLNATAITLTSVDDGVLQTVQISSAAVAVDAKISDKVALQLTRQDAIRIQLAAPLATSIVAVNMTIDDAFSTDVAGNFAMLRDGASTGNFPPFTFVEDSVAPTLLAVYLRTATGVQDLTLYFSEVVEVTSIVQSAIFLASSSGTTVSLNNAVRSSGSAPARSVTYSLLPLAAQLTTAGLAQGQTSTHVFVGITGAVVDASPKNNAIVGMSIIAAIRDGLVLTSFRLDMTAGTLSLELAYPSAIGSVDATKLTLYSADLSKNYPLQGIASYVLDSRGPMLILRLTDDDYKVIRFRFTVASSSDLILQIGATAVVDGNSKSLSSAVTLRCSHFVPDTLPLTIDVYELDLEVGTLRLRFSKEAETGTLDLTDALSLHLTAVGADPIPLTGLTVIDEPDILGYIAPNVTSLLLSLNNGAPLTTREKILLAYPMASTVGTTFLSAKKGLIYDLARPRNPLRSIAITSGGGSLQTPSVLTLDEQPPLFRSFDLDLNTRILTLVFSEAIDMSTVNADHVTFLQDPDDASSLSYELTASSAAVSVAPGVAVRILLSETDVNAMMALSPDLLHSTTNTYIALRAGAVSDLAVPSNPSPVTLFRYGMPVSSFVADTTPPRMRWYNMSVQTGDIVMHLDELVVCASVRPEQIVIQSTEYNGAKSQFYRLSNASAVDCSFGPKYDNFVYITIDPDDLIALKTFPAVAKTMENTYLRLLPGAVEDLFGNLNEEIKDGFARQPTLFIPDTSAPQLLSFLVNQHQQLLLFFNEPVNPRTNLVRECYFQNLYSAPTQSYPFIESVLFRSSPSRMQLDYDIRKDMKFITSGQQDVLVKQDYTFLRITSAAVQDFSGNALLERTRYNSLQIGPSVIAWSLDMNTGEMDITFSEPVATTFSLVGFVMQDKYDDDATRLVFTTSAVVSTRRDSTVYVALNQQDMYALKLSGLVAGVAAGEYDISSGPGSTPSLYLTASYGLTVSTNGGDIQPFMDAVEVLTTNAVRIKRLSKDVTAPVCESFSIDLNTGELLLNFDEPTRPSSLLLPLLVLSSSVSGRFVALDNLNRNVTLQDSTQLVVKLSQTDLNALKRAVATSSGLSILDSLVMYAGAVQDLRGNAFVGNDPDHPIAIDQFVPDVSSPQLESWTLDRSAMMLRLTFNEYVNQEFFFPENLVLLSTSDYLTAPVRMQLSNYSKITASLSAGNEILVDLRLYRQDAFALEAIASAGLGTSVTNTYLAITSLRDIFGNSQSAVQVVGASAVEQDTTPLLLQAFDWTHAGGSAPVTVTLYFSKVVDTASFTCEDFEFRDAPLRLAAHIVGLTSSDCTLTPGQVDSHIVQFTVPISLFAATTIGDSPETTYLGVPVVGATADLSGNVLALIRSDRYLQVGPQLLRYQLNMDTGLVTYDFSKPLDYSIQFNASQFGFFSQLTHRTYLLRSVSTAGMISLVQLPIFPAAPENSTIGALYLDTLDLVRLKQLDVRASKLFAVVTAGASLEDLAGQALVAHPASRQLPVSSIVVDDLAPSILHMALNLSTEIITIELDEPIRLSTVVVPHFCLQGTADLATRPASYYCLTDSVASTVDTTLTLTLSATDAAAIKLKAGLAEDLASTFLSFEYYTVEDMARNQLPAVTIAAARQFDALEMDVVPPTLDAFILDVSNPSRTLLQLIFSEPVDAGAINMTTITVQSRYARRDGIQYRLTGGTVHSTDLYTVVIALLPQDVTAMKLIPGLIRSKQSSYLVVDPFMTTDLAGNALVPYLDGAALSCLAFAKDLSPPQIVQSLFNINDGTLTFVFNEPVVPTTVDVTALTLQLSAASGGALLVSFGNNMARYTLTTLSYVVDPVALSDTVVIRLSASDFDELKNRYPLLAKREETWFSYTSLFVEDTSRNAIQQVRATAPLQVTDFISDTTRPTILSYALDMNRQLVTLVFSEAVKADSVDLSQLTLQSIETRRLGSHVVLNESSFSIGVGSGSNTMKVRIGEATMAYMKVNGIGAAQFQSYLSWTDNFVSDFSDNYLAPLWDGSVLGFNPREPDVLQLDTQAPVLQRWFLHRTTTALTAHLFYDEPVRLVNTSSLLVRFTTRNAATGRPVIFGTAAMAVSSPLALFPPTVQYAENNRKIVLKLSNYCTSHAEMSLTAPCLLSKEPADNLFAVLNQTATAGTGYFLALEEGVTTDFATVANPSERVGERKALAEKGPDCTLCAAAGQFTSAPCTATTDRVCRACATCPSGTYVQATCSAYQDTACAACSTCGYGNYIQAPCTATSNTQCAACTVCGGMQYASRQCERGLDTLCNTCAVCSFVDAAVKKTCEADKAYLPWQRANCCKDPKGAKVPCAEKDRSEILQASIDGRHHWDFGSTSPRIDDVRNPGIRFPKGF